jgi:hypothetical protein
MYSLAGSCDTERDRGDTTDPADRTNRMEKLGSRQLSAKVMVLETSLSTAGVLLWCLAD